MNVYIYKVMFWPSYEDILFPCIISKHNQDQDGDFALFWTSVGAQMSLLFSAEVNADVYVYKVTFLPKI